MRLGQTILSFALALLWLGMPVHCQLEAVSAASLFACADDADCASPRDSGCEDDFCDSVESGNYFHQKAAGLGKAPLPHPSILPEPAPAIAVKLALPEILDSVPLPHIGWQFARRATGSPRAPSLTA